MKNEILKNDCKKLTCMFVLFHDCLTECLDRCFLIHDLFAPYMPWRSNHLLATEVADLKMDLMDVKGFRADIEVDHDFSSDCSFSFTKVV